MYLVALLLSLGVAAPRAQRALTADQRDADMTQLASMYAKEYAPYEWKRDVIGFDLQRLTPWLQRVHQADDLDVQDAFLEYLASLQDTHAFMSFPSPFGAVLGFTVDIYDGKVLIDSINRTLLPSAQYPFGIGDELVSLDGDSAQTLIASFRKVATSGGNPRSRDRVAAGLIARRFQSTLPHASQVGDTAVASIRLASTGALKNYVMPWVKSGVALDSEGPVPGPRRGNGLIFRAPDPNGAAVRGGRRQTRAASQSGLPQHRRYPAGLWIRSGRCWTLGSARHDERRARLRIQVADLRPAAGLRDSPWHAVVTFLLERDVCIERRADRAASHPQRSAAQYIGRPATAQSEIAFFNANTDVLVVDITRNTGGNLSTAEAFAQRLIPNTFRTVGFEFRATALEVFFFAQRLTSALGCGAPPEIIANLRSNFDEMLSAYNEERDGRHRFR